MKLKLIFATLSLALCLVATAITAEADPLFFSNVVALQNAGQTSVDLFSNPGITLTGQQLSFLVDINGDIPGSPSQILQITYEELGSAPKISTFNLLIGEVQPPFSLLFTVTTRGSNSQTTPVKLIVDILGSAPDFVVPGGPRSGDRVDSYTYTFNVAQ